MERGLVDEYRLLVFPTVAGEGKRLFSRGAFDLELVSVRPRRRRDASLSTETAFAMSAPGKDVSATREAVMRRATLAAASPPRRHSWIVPAWTGAAARRSARAT